VLQEEVIAAAMLLPNTQQSSDQTIACRIAAGASSFDGIVIHLRSESFLCIICLSVALKRARGLIKDAAINNRPYFNDQTRSLEINARGIPSSTFATLDVRD